MPDIQCPFCGKSYLELEAPNNTVFCRDCGATGPRFKGFGEWVWLHEKEKLMGYSPIGVNVKETTIGHPFKEDFLTKCSDVISMFATAEHIHHFEKELCGIIYQHFDKDHAGIAKVIKPILIHKEREEFLTLMWAVKPEAVSMFDYIIEAYGASSKRKATKDQLIFIQDQKYKNYNEEEKWDFWVLESSDYS